MTQTGNYNLDKALENREALIEKMKAQVHNALSEKESADKMVEVLKNELKLQSEHFEKTAKG